MASTPSKPGSRAQTKSQEPAPGSAGQRSEAEQRAVALEPGRSSASPGDPDAPVLPENTPEVIALTVPAEPDAPVEPPDVSEGRHEVAYLIEHARALMNLSPHAAAGALLGQHGKKLSVDQAREQVLAFMQAEVGSEESQ